MLPAFFAYMEFRTLVNIKPFAKKMTYDSKVVSLGSCFSSEMGRRLLDRKYDVLLNPLGIAFNPLSIAMQIEKSLDLDYFNEDDFFCRDGIWRSFLLHSDFSGELQNTILNANNALRDANEYLKTADFILLTFGSAFVYRHKEQNFVVANCHKLPSERFERTMIDADQVYDALSQYVAARPARQWIFTVSPVRHLADGLHANTLSKSTLHLGIEKLVNRYPNAHYFPAYEILLDELRDYRFYADDMMHPSAQAADYIFERFMDFALADSEKPLLAEAERVRGMMQHHILNPNTPRAAQFEAQRTQALESLLSKIR